jgi:hypothetical protein
MRKVSELNDEELRECAFILGEMLTKEDIWIDIWGECRNCEANRVDEIIPHKPGCIIDKAINILQIKRGDIS